MPTQSSICFVSSIPITLWTFYQHLITRLVREGYSVTIISSPMPPLDDFKKMGCSIVPIPITRIISPWQDICTTIKIFAALRKIRPSIVHAHTPKGGLLTMVAATLARIRCRLYTCHGLALDTETGFKRFLMTCSEKLTFALAHRVLVVSHSLSQKLAEYRIGSEAKKLILGNGTACGVDTTLFNRTPELAARAMSIRQSLKIPSEAVVIGFVGRLVPDKGIHILIDAFSELYLVNDRIRLLIIGDAEPHRGALPDETVRLIDQHPGIRRIGFTRQIEQYYVCIDILALPSRREGFNYVLLEAAAMQIPVVSTKVTGCVDAVVDGKTGFLVEPDNTAALVEALQKLINDPSLRISFGLAARKRVEKDFRIGPMIDLHMNLYAHYLSIPTGPVPNEGNQDSKSIEV